MSIRTAVFAAYTVATRPLIGHKLGEVPGLGGLYQTITRALLPEESRIVQLDGFRLAVNVAGIDGIGRKLLYDRTYEPITSLLFREAVTPGAKVVDVGANIGYYSLLAHSLGAKVVAFEPHPANYALLCENVELNGAEGRVRTHAVAVGNKVGEATLMLGRESGEHSLVRCRRDAVGELQVTLVSLDSFVRGPVQVLKTDTEGNDMGVLRGAVGLIETSSRMTAFVEFWPKGLMAAGCDLEAVWFFLASRFNRIRIIDEQQRKILDGGLATALDCVAKHGFAVNLICEKGV